VLDNRVARGRSANRRRTRSPPPSGLLRANLLLRAVGGGVMAYVPDWGRLTDALKRITAVGVSDDEARHDISHAIADGKIRVRVTIAERTSDIARTLTGAQVKPPPHLMPDDFDWQNSRPLRPWPTGPREWKSDERHSFSWRNRPISLIEVRLADVIALTERTVSKPPRDGAPSAAQESAAIEDLASHLKSNPDLKRQDAATIHRRYVRNRRHRCRW
jgi:hypothetical protein